MDRLWAIPLVVIVVVVLAALLSSSIYLLHSNLLLIILDFTVAPTPALSMLPPSSALLPPLGSILLPPLRDILFEVMPKLLYPPCNLLNAPAIDRLNQLARNLPGGPVRTAGITASAPDTAARAPPALRPRSRDGLAVLHRSQPLRALRHALPHPSRHAVAHHNLLELRTECSRDLTQHLPALYASSDDIGGNVQRRRVLRSGARKGIGG